MGAAKRVGFYGESKQRKRAAPEQEGEGTSTGRKAQRRGSRVTLARQVEVGRQTLIRTVGERYDVDDGERYRAKRAREDTGDEAQRRQRMRAGGTEYDDGG